MSSAISRAASLTIPIGLKRAVAVAIVAVAAVCLAVACAMAPAKAWAEPADDFTVNEYVSGLYADGTASAGMEVSFDGVKYASSRPELSEAYSQHKLWMQWGYRTESAITPDYSEMYEMDSVSPVTVPESPDGAILWIKITNGTTDPYSEAYSKSIDVRPSDTCDDNIAWNLSPDGVLSISPANAAALASVKEGYGYGTGPWYEMRDAVTAIDIKAGVKRIGGYAFCQMENLAQVTLPDGLESIGTSAFYECTSLKSIVIPASVTNLGPSTFDGCAALADVTFKGADTQLGNYVFNSCPASMVVTGYAVENAGEQSVPVFCFDNKVLFNAVNGDLGTYLLDLTGDKTVTWPNSGSYLERDAFWASVLASSAMSSGEAVGGIDCDNDGAADIEIAADESQSVYKRASTCSVADNLTVKLTDTERMQAVWGYPDGFYYGALKFRFAEISISKATVTIPAQTYTGAALMPAATVKYGSQALKVGTDYTIKYSNNTNAGTATATLTGIGDFAGSVSKAFTINKAKPTAKAKKKTVKAKAGKTVSNLVVKCDKGKVSYKNASKGAAKSFKVNKKTGKVTVPKGTQKGTYKVKVKVTVKAGKNYLKAKKTVSFKVKVK